MCVIRERQSVVAYIIGTIDGLCHGSYRHRLDEVLLAFAVDGVEQCVIRFNKFLSRTDVHRITEFRNKLYEIV